MLVYILKLSLLHMLLSAVVCSLCVSKTLTPVVSTDHLWSDHPRGLLIPDVNALILARCSSTVFPSVFINWEFGMKVVEENSAIRMLQHYQKSLMEIWALLLNCQTELFHFSLISFAVIQLNVECWKWGWVNGNTHSQTRLFSNTWRKSKFLGGEFTQ